MRFRLTLTLHIGRDHDERPETEHAPEVDFKGAAILERSHQDEPNDLRTGFQPTEGPR